MLYVLMGILLLGADILSKLAAIRYLMPVDTIALWEGVFHLTYVENRGAAFGMLAGGRVFFVAMSILAIGVFFYLSKRYKNTSKCLDWALVLLTAGTLGNLIDRLFRGYVVDFLDFCLIDFPVFNLADIYVCTGAGLLALFVIFIEGKNNEN